MSAVVTFGEILVRLTSPGPTRLAQAPNFEIALGGGAEANVAAQVKAVLTAKFGFTPKATSYLLIETPQPNLVAGMR
jgi:hypothetical protein